MSKVLSEDEVKKILDVKDFRSISKDKIMEFVSLIPNMNKEVAMAAIAQFPNYADMAKGMTDGLIKLCDNAVKEVSVGNRETIELYKEILVNLQNQLKEENYSPEQKIKINEQMIEVANKISMTNTERNTLINNIIKYGGSIVSGALVLGAVVLGVNINKKK